MKIVYVITRSDRVGGAQLHVRDLAAAVQGLGHDVHVLVGGQGDEPYFPLLEQAGVQYTIIPSLIRPIRPTSDWRCVGELKREIERLSPDLVHAHSSKAGLLGRYVAHRAGIPAVFSAHGWSFTEGIARPAAMVYRNIERIGARWCEKILCGCESDRQLGLREGVGDEAKIETIWYGLHPLDQPVMADPSTDPPNMVMVARFEPQKDHDTLIRGLATVKDLPWTIDLLGDGPLCDNIKQLSNDLGIADRLRFVGAQPTFDYLLRSQLFLLITNWEGLPLSTLEAMRVGLPLIGSGVGGIPEQIVEGETGYVVPRGDVQRLGTRLRTLLSDPEMRTRFGAKGKQRFDSDFQYERMLMKVEDVYKRVAKG